MAIRSYENSGLGLNKRITLPMPYLIREDIVALPISEGLSSNAQDR